MLLLVAALSLVAVARAHLLPTQHATLRFADSKVYLALTINPSALAGNTFPGTAMTADYFAARYDELARRVTAGIELISTAGSAELLDLRLAPSLAHDSSNGEIDSITVLAVFDLESAAGLVFATELFAVEPGGDRYEIVCSSKDGRLRQSYVLSRDAPRVSLQGFALTL